MFNPETVKAGDKNTSVLLLQEILRARGFKGKNGKALKLNMDSRCKHDLRSESLSGIQKRSFGSGWYLRICYLERLTCDLK